MTSVMRIQHPIIKIIVLGERLVGRTSVIQRIIGGEFQERIRPFIGIRILSMNYPLNLDNRSTIEVHFWDVGCQEHFDAMKRDLVARADGIMFVADATNMESIHALQRWWDEVASLIERGVPWICLVNKIDAVSAEFKLSELESQLPASFRVANRLFFVSAKDGTNIKTAFESLMSMIIAMKFPK